MVYIRIFLYQGYDILFYCEAHCTSPALDRVGSTTNSYVTLEYFFWRADIISDISPECRARRI